MLKKCLKNLEPFVTQRILGPAEFESWKFKVTFLLYCPLNLIKIILKIDHEELCARVSTSAKSKPYMRKFAQSCARQVSTFCFTFYVYFFFFTVAHFQRFKKKENRRQCFYHLCIILAEIFYLRKKEILVSFLLNLH